MLKYVAAFLLCASMAHAQSRENIERACKSASEMEEIVAIFLQCERNGKARYEALSVAKKFEALSACLKKDIPRGVSERQRTAIEYCSSEMED